jgi:hypothetical protein
VVDEGLLKDLRVDRSMLLLPHARSSVAVVDVTVLDIEYGTVLSCRELQLVSRYEFRRRTGEKRYSSTILNLGTRWR